MVLTANTAGFVAGMGRAGSAAKVFGTVIAVGLALSLSQAIQFESAMAGVAKTVDATAGEMRVLEQGIVSMANRMPATREEIAGVAEAAGQLGISKGALLDFTEVAVKLGTATNLSASDAATGLAKVANIMGTSESDFDRMGSTLVRLGNNGASTESDILSMTERLAGIGAVVGASEADMLGLANAMSSMGIEAELGGGATQRIFQIIQKAVEVGGTSLEGFAATSAMSAESFAAAWQKDPVKAYQALIKGLGDVKAQGGSLIATLDALGISGTHNRQVIYPLVAGYDVLTESLKDASIGWEENNDLNKEAEKRYKTTAAQLQILRNQVTNVGRGLGDVMIPALLGGIGATKDFGSWLQEMAVEHGPRLASAWQRIATTGEHLAEVIDTAHEAGQPLVEDLAALGASGMIAGLTGVAGGLEKVGGFLAENEWLVKAALAATVAWAGTRAWSMIVSGIETIYIRWLYAQGAITSSTVLGSLGLMARGVGQVGIALATLPAASNMSALTTGLNSVRMGLSGVVSAINPVTLGIFALTAAYFVFQQRTADARAEMERFKSEIGAVAEAGVESAEDLEKAFRGKLAKSLAGVSGGFEGIGSTLNYALTEAGISADDLFRILGDGDVITGEMVMTAANLEGVVGGASDEFYTLANAWIESRRTASELARQQRELGVETDEASDAAGEGTAAQRALADASGRTVEEVIAQEDAWAELADTMRETWASAFDLGSEFSGRMTLHDLEDGVADLGAGVAANVAEIEASLADASRDISEGLDDTLADISKSLADTDKDVGKGLAKSLAGIDEDLAETVADIQGEMAAARFEMSGEDLAEALSRGQERIADATKDAAERRSEAEESAAERRAEAAEDASEREADAIEEAREREAEAVEEAEKRKADAWAASDKSLTDYVDQQGVTGQQIADFYADQTVKVTEFASNIGRAFELGYDPRLISDLLQQGPDEAAGTVETLVNEFSATLLWQVNAGVVAMESLSDEAVEIGRLTNRAMNELSDEGAAAVDTAMAIHRAKAKLGTRATAQAIATELGIGVTEVLKVATWYEIGLVGAVNPILEALGQPKIVGRGDTGVRTPGGGFAFNTGGRVPGSGPNVDSVLAWVTPGEHVITQPKAKEWGHGFFDDINSGRLNPGDLMAAGYNEGGEVLLAAGRRLEAAGARITEHPAWDAVDPVHVKGSYHYRNSSGTGADAFDANYGAGTSDREMAFFDEWAPIIAGMGLRVLWRVAGHYNHLHADLGGPGYGMGGSGNYSGGGFAGNHYADLPAPPEVGAGILADTAEKAMKAAFWVATDWKDKQYSPTAVMPVAPGTTGGNEANRAIGQSMAASRYGWVGNEWNALNLLWDHESGWNHLAINPSSGAGGIPQALPMSKMASHGADYRTNAGTQISWGLDYIHDRPDYGRPSEAWRLWNARYPHWYNRGGPVLPGGSYDQGGHLPTGLSLAYNGTGRPEPVGHHLIADANRALQVQVRVENHTHVHLGDRDLGPYVDSRSLSTAETVVDADHRRSARLARMGSYDDG